MKVYLVMSESESKTYVVGAFDSLVKANHHLSDVTIGNKDIFMNAEWTLEETYQREYICTLKDRVVYVKTVEVL